MPFLRLFFFVNRCFCFCRFPVYVKIFVLDIVIALVVKYISLVSTECFSFVFVQNIHLSCWVLLECFFSYLRALFIHHLLINTSTPIDELVICSLNVRGLSNTLKRFRWPRMKKLSIFFLQEVHCTKEKEPLWSSEWGSSAFFSSFSSASAGVCILFNNNFEFKVMRQFSDPEGRFIIIDIKIENKIITLVNIYAPNDDNPAFFKKVLSHLLPFDCEEIVLGGDFNLVLDVQKDKKGGNPVTHKNSLKEVQNIANSLDLIDIWRVFNSDAKRFTWRRKNPEIHCRLDFFLTSASLSPAVTKADILAGYKTDHSLITLHLANNNNPRGPGFWKLNTPF